jgi:hypothetical protein
MTDHHGSPDESESPALFLVEVVLGALAAENLLSSQQLQRFVHNFRNWLKERPKRQQDLRSASDTRPSFSISIRFESSRQRSDALRALLESSRRRSGTLRALFDPDREHSDPWRARFDPYRELSDPYREVILHVTNQRNRLAHGFDQDRRNLLHDQEEIRDDYRIAVLVLLANERPDLLLRAAEQLLRSGSEADRESRARKVLLSGLQDAITNPNIGLPESVIPKNTPGFPSTPKDI